MPDKGGCFTNYELFPHSLFYYPDPLYIFVRKPSFCPILSFLIFPKSEIEPEIFLEVSCLLLKYAGLSELPYHC